MNREVKTDINPVALQDPVLRTQRSYVNVSDNRTTTLMDTYSNLKHTSTYDTVLSKYSYTYDSNGNISTVMDQDGKTTTYTYDQLNQLIRADDEKSGVSTVYSYDVGGNITSVSTYAYTTDILGASTGTVPYIYGNDNWKDLLTSYNGQNITYDAIGNPLSYRDGINFTWEGRQLKTAVANGKNISYTYNSDGIRTGKTVDGTTTKYLVDGSTVIAQQSGSDVLWFLYESDGNRVGFTYNGTAYYYTKNAQGNVTGLVDSNANTVVEYSYDSWGKLLSTTGSLAGTIGKINPFLYRGYYYDSEIGLYYLNSRYYDPQSDRFINADSFGGQVGSINSHNIFAYCMNNPVLLTDDQGTRPLAHDSSTRETKEELEVSAKEMLRATAITAAGRLTIANGQTVDLGKGWKARIDLKGTPEEHMHVYNNKKSEGWYAQNSNGSPHDKDKNGPNPSGPPKSVKKSLNEITGWDWNEKESNFKENCLDLADDPFNQFFFFPSPYSSLAYAPVMGAATQYAWAAVVG